MLKHFLSKKYWNSVKLLTEIAIIRQNKNSFLGSIWGLIQPFLHVIIISHFFGLLLRQPTETMIINLVGGMSFWNFFASTLNIASTSLVSREGILKKVIISKTLFPLADSMTQIYTLIYSFLAMYAAFIIYHPEQFNWHVIFVPIMALPLIISTLSGAIAVSFLTPYIRDIPQMIGVLLGVVYWTLPIIYPYSLIPDSKKIFFEINPIFLLIRPIQYLVVEGQFPDLLLMVKSFIVSIISVIISYLIYKRLTRNVIYYL